jgi:hypothetical protein
VTPQRVPGRRTTAEVLSNFCPRVGPSKRYLQSPGAASRLLCWGSLLCRYINCCAECCVECGTQTSHSCIAVLQKNGMAIISQPMKLNSARANVSSFRPSLAARALFLLAHWEPHPLFLVNEPIPETRTAIRGAGGARRRPPSYRRALFGRFCRCFSGRKFRFRKRRKAVAESFQTSRRS